MLLSSGSLEREQIRVHRRRRVATTPASSSQRFAGALRVPSIRPALRSHAVRPRHVRRQHVDGALRDQATTVIRLLQLQGRAARRLRYAEPVASSARPKVVLPMIAAAIIGGGAGHAEDTSGRSGDPRLSSQLTDSQGASVFYELAGRLGGGRRSDSFTVFQRHHRRPCRPRSALPLSAIETRGLPTACVVVRGSFMSSAAVRWQTRCASARSLGAPDTCGRRYRAM